MNIPVIYKIRNVTNQKFYVGSTTNKRERFRNHRKQLRGGRHHCPHLQAAWDKYGEECFVFEVVEEVATVADLFAAENRWLDAHFGQPYCYNAGRSAAAPMRGRTGHLHPSYQREWPQEMRSAISASVKRKYAEDPDYAPRRGKTHTNETKAAISRARVGKHAGANHYRYGKQVSTEVRAKIGDTQRGKPKAPGRKVSAEGLAKIRANIEAGRSHKHWIGRTHTDEARAKLSAPVVAKAPDGTEARYASITDLRSHLGLKPSTVNRALKSGAPLTKGPRVGWSFRYAVQ